MVRTEELKINHGVTMAPFRALSHSLVPTAFPGQVVVTAPDTILLFPSLQTGASIYFTGKENPSFQSTKTRVPGGGAGEPLQAARCRPRQFSTRAQGCSPPVASRQRSD